MGDDPFEAVVLLRAEQTSEAVSAVALTVPAGWEGPPLHHHAFDETVYVLEGELTFQLGDQVASAGPNTLVFAPSGAVHTIANLDGAQARYLLLCTPAGFERRFDPDARDAPETVVVGGNLAHRDDVPRRRARPLPHGVNVLVRGEHGTGQIAVMDNSISPSYGGPPLHHHDFDELVYVIEGELSFQVGSDVVRRRAGELAFAPRGVHHAWANHSDAAARALMVYTPARFEAYFGRIAAALAGLERPAWASQPVPPAMVVGPRIPRDRRTSIESSRIAPAPSDHAAGAVKPSFSSSRG